MAARNLAEKAARAALEAMAVQHHEAYGHMNKPQKDLRNKLRAHARQLGDVQDGKGNLSIEHLAQACAYEHWHRMLFARFLAENSLLIEPEMGVAISLAECKELAKDGRTNLWALAGRYAQAMLPEVFRADDPVLQVPVAREDQLKLEQLLDALPVDVFTASDSLGWCYQFWQEERKGTVNDSGDKIGADELPSVTQLFTDDYMVDFLLDNTLGAWWAGRLAAVNSGQFSVASCPTEEEARKRCALPGCPWKYLRFVKKKIGGVEVWTPAAGTFGGWPKAARELKCLDPCMGSGHFVVAMFERLLAVRVAEEKLEEKAAVTAVIRDNLFGLELDARCTQIAAMNLALCAWRRVGHCSLPPLHLACSGLAPQARKEEWVALAGADAGLRFAMGALYELFRKGPLVGSLVNPRRDKAVTYASTVQELRPLLAKALGREATDEVHELAVTAQGIAKAAELLSGEFTLVATNVPYLGAGRQSEGLCKFCEENYRDASDNLACVFLDRAREFLAPGGSVALVVINEFLFLGAYARLRERLLRSCKWDFVARLGPRAFEKIGGERVNVCLLALTKAEPGPAGEIFVEDVGNERTPKEKAARLLSAQPALRNQRRQIENPDSRLILEEARDLPILQTLASSLQGISPADFPHYGRCFWEVRASREWQFWQSTIEGTMHYGGRELMLWWGQDLEEAVQRGQAYIRGQEGWGKWGVVVKQMGKLPVTLYCGEKFDTNCAVVVPRKAKDLLPIWCFCSSDEFGVAVRQIDQKLNVTNATLVKVPFDLAHWEKVAAKDYPQGLPKPFSSDPTQWLFSGHPKGADQPLQVAVARLVGYSWPRQTGSSFPDCPALAEDGLEKLSDADGIVCIPSVRGEELAADRLRKLLAGAYGKDWKAGTELELIRATGSESEDLEQWLRNDFFRQHCDLFHQRPFVWHIWDGRKRDGFHALVNYHRLAGEKGKGRRTLESLTHSYLGEWIARQKDGEKRGEAGAEERLAAALELKERLEAIIEGDPPFDVFVRWKGLADQAIGWEPDINDGVRMNIRPFMASDLPSGKAGAGVLRWKPNVKWDKDRGKEPKRDKKDFPWFWSGVEFTGDRVNDVHLTNEQKRKARKE